MSIDDSVDPDSPEGLGSAAAPLPTGQELSGREPLDRQKILRAAVVMIDENDLRHLTMRRLGTSLGVEAMAL